VSCRVRDPRRGLPLDEIRNDQEGKPHYAEQKKPQVLPVPEDPECHDQEQPEPGQKDHGTDHPEEGDLTQDS
jgi:hypothetical protein